MQYPNMPSPYSHYSKHVPPYPCPCRKCFSLGATSARQSLAFPNFIVNEVPTTSSRFMLYFNKLKLPAVCFAPLYDQLLDRLQLSASAPSEKKLNSTRTDAMLNHISLDPSRPLEARKALVTTSWAAELPQLARNRYLLFLIARDNENLNVTFWKNIFFQKVTL